MIWRSRGAQSGDKWSSRLDAYHEMLTMKQCDNKEWKKIEKVPITRKLIKIYEAKIENAQTIHEENGKEYAMTWKNQG